MIIITNVNVLKLLTNPLKIIIALKNVLLKKSPLISCNPFFIMYAGKKVKSYKGDFTKNDTFDISTLNTGTYIVKVEDNNNKTKTTKLVKL